MLAVSAYYIGLASASNALPLTIDSPFSLLSNFNLRRTPGGTRQQRC